MHLFFNWYLADCCSDLTMHYVSVLSTEFAIILGLTIEFGGYFIVCFGSDCLGT